MRKKFNEFAEWVNVATGSAQASLLALLIVLGWLLSGPLFDFSETWQLVINTTTTVITFLMVFVIQHSANIKDLAVHAKLDGLISAIKEADNSLIGIEKQIQ